jgi:hypothetical protein
MAFMLAAIWDQHSQKECCGPQLLQQTQMSTAKSAARMICFVSQNALSMSFVPKFLRVKGQRLV